MVVLLQADKQGQYHIWRRKIYSGTLLYAALIINALLYPTISHRIAFVSHDITLSASTNLETKR